MTELVLDNATVVRQQRELLKGVSLRIEPGELVALLGANGAGKSTLARAMLGLTVLHSGVATLDGEPAASVSPEQRARSVAYLPQQRSLSWPLSVFDTVALGRFAAGVRLGRLAKIDVEAVTAALQACDLAHLRERRVDRLSGGELSRVHFARALASRAPLIVADEPVAELDPWHQFQLMSFMREYVNRGNGAVVIVHDPELAARYADRLVWMVAGRVVADGSVPDTLTSHQLAHVYNMEAEVFWRGDQAQVTLLGRCSTSQHVTGQAEPVSAELTQPESNSPTH